MKLKLDENLGIRHREQLQRAGHDVDTVHDEHLSGAPDPDVLEAAAAAGRALVTLDVDFANPIRFPPQRTAGIAVLRVRERSAARTSSNSSTTSSEDLPDSPWRDDSGSSGKTGSASTSRPPANRPPTSHDGRPSRCRTVQPDALRGCGDLPEAGLALDDRRLLASTS